MVICVVLKDILFEMGTGKTCTAIAAIEQLRYEKNRHINRAIVCAKGAGLLNNFSQELLFSCTDGRYIPDNYDKLSDLERIHRTRKITSAFYQFSTFETFAKEIAKMNDDTLAERFNNTIFVIDEVHNLREKDEVVRKEDDVRSLLMNKRAVGLSEPLDVYKQFHRLFHVVKESKILLMSGTVMKSDTYLFYIDVYLHSLPRRVMNLEFIDGIQQIILQLMVHLFMPFNDVPNFADEEPRISCPDDNLHPKHPI